MREETKNVIYITLDILNSLAKTSQETTSFIKIDKKTLELVRKELFELIKTNRTKSINEKKIELIGILPSILVDKQKFPTNKDLIKFAEKSLNFYFPKGNKSRSEIVGIIIDEISRKSDKDIELFLKALKEFLKNNNEKKQSNVTSKSFVDTWLEFFNHYKQ